MKVSCAFLIPVLFFAWTTGVGAEERKFTLMERELEYLMAFWPGDYDNREQLQFDSDVGKKNMDEGGHLRVHSHIRRVTLPEFGPYVLYVEEYKHNDPSQIFRQRLYELSVDEPEKAIRLKLHFLSNGNELLGAHTDPSKLSTLTRDDTAVLDGCDVFIRRDGDRFVGAMKTKQCVFGEGEERRYSDYQLQLQPGQYWFRDRILSYETDQPLEQVADFSWHQLEQARHFVCMIDVPREPGGRPVKTQHYIHTHDQGGTFAFKHPDGRDMVFTMRNTWSYGMRRETLVVVVQEGDESGPTLVYAWAEPGADRIGVNPGYLRVQCDLDTAENVQLQQWLRTDS